MNLKQIVDAVTSGRWNEAMGYVQLAHEAAKLGTDIDEPSFERALIAARNAGVARGV